MASRNVRLMIGDKIFELRNQKPNELRADFIWRINAILSNMGGAFNAEPSKNIRIVVGKIGEENYKDFVIGIPTRGMSRENFIKRLVEDLSNFASADVNDLSNINVASDLSPECRAAFNCPICLYQYSDDIQPTTLPCGHSLCITDASHVNSICPICRSPFVFANQRMSISLRDASIACSPGAHGGAHTRRRHKTKRRRQRSKRRR